MCAHRDSNSLIVGHAPRPLGNNNLTAAPPGTFKTSDGWLIVAASKLEQIGRLCEHIGRSDLIGDSRFADRDSRKTNRAALTVEIERALIAKSAADWETILNRAGIPAGRVASVPEALENPQVQGRGLLQTFADVPGIARPVTLTRAGFKLSGADPFVASAPPRLGQHTDEVLRELGYNDGDIEGLRAAGAI